MDIKLFVCCHKSAAVPQQPLLTPIQVGAALAKEHFPGFLCDDTGDNISRKNRSYCELTAQYWAWKNVRADYYGFFHYRRYLYPARNVRRPYRIERKPSSSLLDKLGYCEFADMIRQYDLILPKGEDMHIPVREHYAQAPFHYRKDLELVEQIVREQHPEMAKAMDDYLSNTVCCFGNIFIMRRQVFQDYCLWLFSILEKFDGQADMLGYSPQELRADGYLAERLLGVYAAYRRELRTLELPRVHFVAEPAERYSKRIVNAILPPGSGRRAKIKKLIDQRRP